MEPEDLKGKLLLFAKQNLVIVVLVVAGVICLGYGLILLSDSANSEDEIIVGSVKTEDSASKIFSDIEGAVLKPGVYELSSDSRLQDLIIAAGGLSADADRDWIAKNINLAQRISDGAKLYIPKIGEKKVDNVLSAGQNQSGLVNINSATALELDTLPGIGPATAEKIIQNRPYNTLDELVSKKAVGSKVFENIKDKITIY